MQKRSGSSGLRWMAVFLLALGALPMSFAWMKVRHSDAGTPESAAVAPEQTDSADLTPGVIDVQLKPGADDAELADLGRLIGIQFAWNSPIAKGETDVADAALPAGADVDADLA